jgi:hypothetical protein
MASPVPTYVDERYERAGGGGVTVAVASVTQRCRRATPAADRAGVLDRIRRHLCVRGGPLAASPGIGPTVPRSAMVVPAKYQGRLGSARNSAAEIARDDINGDRLTGPAEDHSISTQLLRGE